MNKIEAPTGLCYGKDRYGFDPIGDYLNFCLAFVWCCSAFMVCILLFAILIK